MGLDDYPDFQKPENFPTSALRAIRAMCLQCVGESAQEVKLLALRGGAKEESDEN